MPNDQSQSGGRRATIARGSIAPVSAIGRPPRIEIPRWVQLVGLPLLLVLRVDPALRGGSRRLSLPDRCADRALLLDPIVRALQRARLPRGLSVAIVFLSFAAALGLVIVAVATAVVGETKTAANRFNDYFTHRVDASGQTAADADVDRLQIWLNTHHLKSLKVRKRGHDFVRQVQAARHRQEHRPHRLVRRGSCRSRSARRSSPWCCSS